AAEAGSIEQGKGEIERSTAGDQPHFIAVPHRTDGANHDAALFFGACNQQVQHSRAQIEAVEHDISGDHDGDEHKPYRFHSHLLARIIHIFEDNKSLICYKHVVETVFEAANEASECLTIAQHSVCCSQEFFISP